jgi:hypothetical protein
VATNLGRIFFPTHTIAATIGPASFLVKCGKAAQDLG